MNKKDIIKTMFMDFFMVTSFVNFAIFILGSIYNKGYTFSYEILLLPPLYGFVGAIPGLMLYSKKELTVLQTVFRLFLILITLEVSLTLITFWGHFTAENISVILSFMVSVLIIYVLVNVISWLLDFRRAGNLMKDLKEYQKQCGCESEESSPYFIK